MNPILRKSLIYTGYVCSALVFLTGILVVITFFLTIEFNHKRVEFEKTVSTLLQKPITVDHIKLGWYHYYYPEIDLEHVTVLDDQTKEPKVAIQQLRMNFNFWESLWRWQLVIRNVTISGVNITITQETSGIIQIQNLMSFNMRDSSTGALLQPNKIVDWVLSQRRLALESIVLHLQMKQQPERQIYLQTFILENSGQHHVITGNIILMQEKPATLNVHFDWNGDIQTYLIASGNLILDLKNLALAKWISNINYNGFEVKNGLVTGRLTVSWRNNQWVTSHFNFQGNDIEVNGSLTPLLLHIDRINSDLTLHQDKKIITEGKINVAGGSISAPGMNLNLTQINGVAQLSENGLIANDIRAKLMNEPATINLAMPNTGTEANELKIGLNSQIAALQLEQIFKIPISQIAQGSANYQAQLFLYHDNPKANKMMINSNLKGLSINVPAEFGKKADQSKDLQVTVEMPSPSSFNIKADYDKKVHMNATEVNKSWSIDVNSDTVAGNMTVPSTLAGNTIVAHFLYLHLNSADSFTMSNERSQLNPAELPALSLSCDDLKIGEFSVGHVSISTTPEKSGLIIKQLTINENILQLSASGSWENAGTHLQGNISSAKISNLLQSWGFDVSNFHGSNADIKFNLNWNGTVYSPSLSELNGDITMNLGPGAIVGLNNSTSEKIGLANLLNLFSLNSFPELNLNSKNLSQNGYTFQSVTAKFKLHSGSVMTDDLVFISPIADIAIKGRIGIEDKDLDLLMGISPHLLGSLPFVATLAGGPIAGAATWAVSHAVSGHSGTRNASYQYDVKGTWAKPVITKIRATPSR